MNINGQFKSLGFMITMVGFVFFFFSPFFNTVNTAFENPKKKKKKNEEDEKKERKRRKGKVIVFSGKLRVQVVGREFLITFFGFHVFGLLLTQKRCN